MLKLCQSGENGLIIPNYRGQLIKEKKKLEHFIAELEIPTYAFLLHPNACRYVTFTKYYYMDILNALTKKKFSYDFNRLKKKKDNEKVAENLEIETVNSPCPSYTGTGSDRHP